jgi:hypothetical protein
MRVVVLAAKQGIWRFEHGPVHLPCVSTAQKPKHGWYPKKRPIHLRGSGKMLPYTHKCLSGSSHTQSVGRTSSHNNFNQWEFQDPKIEVLYHISGHILWGYSLLNVPLKIGSSTIFHELHTLGKLTLRCGGFTPPQMWIKKIAMETRAENHIELLVKTPGNGQKLLIHWEL